jgi:multiple sugar transport system permease protein
MFWNSAAQVFPLVLGQVLLGAPAAWAFARYDFRFKKALFLLYIVLMLMPFRVTMVSSYLVLDGLKLMDTVWAIILPGAASTFPVFIMTRFFQAIPASLTEAAAIDGAGPFKVFLRVGLPLGAPGILSAVVLGFFEYWNALEVPLTFLKDKSLWPLSLYLPAISSENLGVSLIASVVMLTPALLIFLFGQKYLEQGISAAGMKD